VCSYGWRIPAIKAKIPSVEVKGGKQRGSGARKAGALLSSDRTFCLCSNVPSRLKPNVISEVAPDPGHLGAIVGDARAIKSQSRRDVGSPLSLQGVYHAGLVFPVSIGANRRPAD
jgi:hypothetical protein